MLKKDTRKSVQWYADRQVPKKNKNTEVTQKDYSINRSKQAAVLTATDIFFYLLRKED